MKKVLKLSKKGKPRVHIFHGDNGTLLDRLQENSIDSIVCDPPYALNFMGKSWDTGDIVFNKRFWKKVLRVLKPGGHLVAFGGSKTYHRMACAIEDAGFEIRDSLMWLYSNGVPKSQNVAKTIDKTLGKKGKLGGSRSPEHAKYYLKDGKLSERLQFKQEGWSRPWMSDPEAVVSSLLEYLPESDEARLYNGFGTALKPAFEPIVLARKPLSERTIAKNVLKWGTGALNIDGCRVGVSNQDLKQMSGRSGKSTDSKVYGKGIGNKLAMWQPASLGRWPANVLHDGSDEVVGLFPVQKHKARLPRAFKRVKSVSAGYTGRNVYGKESRKSGAVGIDHGDSGSAARFFYCPKASKKDRNNDGVVDNTHPTVKPTDLMRYLCRLITPPGGRVLDPFMGSGSTGKGALLAGFTFIGIDLEEQYTEIACRRLSNTFSKLHERK